jgi:hypothetical protein
LVYDIADRTEWSPEEGPWVDEPDRIDWRDLTGFPQFIKRGPFGAWCGYVGVDSTHPYYERERIDAALNVHGGITYADHCQHGDGSVEKSDMICHIPQGEESPHVWWIGFDCGHYADYVPGMHLYIPQSFMDSTYRNVSYVVEETQKLALQLLEVSLEIQ